MARAAVVTVARGGGALPAAFGTDRDELGGVAEPAGNFVAPVSLLGGAVCATFAGGDVPGLPAGLSTGGVLAFAFETGMLGGGSTFDAAAFAFAVLPGGVLVGVCFWTG